MESKIKLLYLSSCHGALEYDELRTFTELGIKWFSTGIYLHPMAPIPSNADRRSLFPVDGYDLESLHIFRKLNVGYRPHDKIWLSEEFVNRFDVILVSHLAPYPHYLEDNWEVLRNKPVIWRSHCQQSDKDEVRLKPFVERGIKIVRLSPKEQTIPNYAGHTAIIRQSVDFSDFYSWGGNNKILLTFNNLSKIRRWASNLFLYEQIRQVIPCELYGYHNDGVEGALGCLTYKQQLEKLAVSRAYLSLGTKPGPITYNFVEAFCSGIPTIVFGKKLGNCLLREYPCWTDTYEADEIVEHGKTGFIANNLQDVKDFSCLLFNDKQLAQTISDNAREKAKTLFSRSVAKQQWKEVFDSCFSYCNDGTIC